MILNEKIPQAVLDLILTEQKAQGGLFVPPDSEYITKIAQYAELIVHQNGTGVLGYVFFYCNDPEKNNSYITLIGTAEQARGQGIGYGLMQHVLNISRERGFRGCKLEVRKTNKRAFSFYQKIGFSVLEDRGEKYLMSVAIS